MPNGLVFDIQHYALYDGPGIRSALYLKGCPLRCFWCHNPESQRGTAELMAWPDRRELAGEALTSEQALERLLADRVFFEHSGGGVTITGGEPTHQPAFLLALLELLEEQGIHTALETCGYFRPALVDALIARVDLFLFDLKHIDPAKHLAGTGVDNKRVLANFASILSLVGAPRLIPRIPIVPGFNDDDDTIVGIAQFLDKVGYAGPVHLMPHHGWAKSKYQALGRAEQFAKIKEPSDAQLERIRELLCAYHLDPVIYG